MDFGFCLQENKQKALQEMVRCYAGIVEKVIRAAADQGDEEPIMAVASLYQHKAQGDWLAAMWYYRNTHQEPKSMGFTVHTLLDSQTKLIW